MNIAIIIIRKVDTDSRGISSWKIYKHVPKFSYKITVYKNI